jgi:hypothetical protein
MAPYYEQYRALLSLKQQTGMQVLIIGKYPVFEKYAIGT